MQFHRNKSVVGLDIGSTAVKAVQLKRGWKGLRVRALGLAPVAPGSLVDGRIHDKGAVAKAVRASLDGGEFSTTRVGTSLSGNSVIVKRISVPQPAGTGLARAIGSEVAHCLPFDPHDLNTDYVVMDRSSHADEDTVDVFVVAAKKEHIGAYISAIAEAGRSTAIVDVGALALQNAYELNYGVEEEQVVALLDAGADAIKLNILVGNKPIVIRDIPLGGNAFTDAVQKELGVPFEIAEDVKTGKHPDSSLLKQAQPVLEAMADRAVQEIARTFEYLKGVGGERIDHILVTGGGSRLEALFRAIRERFETDVERFNPFRRVTFDARRVAVEAESAAALAAVALGLALRVGETS